jgi:hypothetical protein
MRISGDSGMPQKVKPQDLERQKGTDEKIFITCDARINNSFNRYGICMAEATG